MCPANYRTSNLIIQTILEGIIRADQDNLHQVNGIIKSHLVKYAGLKAVDAEKYLQKMEKAGYIQSSEESWGDRTKIIYKITPLGKERFEWFVKINTELE